MPGHDEANVEVAQQLEHEAQQLVDAGHGGTALTLALDQLRADRANGEPLTTAVRRLRSAIEDGHADRQGGTSE